LSVTSRKISRAATLLLSATLALTAAAPLAAQESTPPADSELVSETASQLPAADLPTMNEQGHTFEFSSTFNGSLSEVPVEAPVYTMQAPTYTAEQVTSTADNLGLEGDVQDMGNGTFTVEGDAGSLFVTPGRMQFISSADAPEGDLPDDESAIASAREWLRVNNLLPANVGDGSVLARIDDPGRIVVGFQPVTPSPLISSTPNVTATIGPEGAVLEATYNWADIAAGETYQLRGAEAAWTEVETRRAWVDASLPTDQFEAGATVSGAVEYTRVSLAYTTSGIPGEQQYLQPVYVFSGELTPDGSDQRFPVRAYVPALINSNQPVG
jgi:hypothetical protein